MEFHVPEMSCGHCTAAITKSITSRDSSAEVTTDLDNRTVAVVTRCTAAEVADAIKAAGYDSSPL